MSTPAAATGQLAALLAALDAEQLAAYGYGTLGPRLGSPTQTTQAHNCEIAHRALAATATTMAASTASAIAGSAPSTATAAAGSYQLPAGAVDASSALRLAVLLEQGCATAWRYVLAQLASDDAAGTRTASADSAWTTAVGALRDSAVRAVMWRRLTDANTASVAFPGI